MCGTLSLLLQVTVEPGATATEDGMKVRSAISTVVASWVGGLAAVVPVGSELQPAISELSAAPSTRIRNFLNVLLLAWQGKSISKIGSRKPYGDFIKSSRLRDGFERCVSRATLSGISSQRHCCSPALQG
jgi:hypothetical protein